MTQVKTPKRPRPAVAAKRPKQAPPRPASKWSTPIAELKAHMRDNFAKHPDLDPTDTSGIPGETVRDALDDWRIVLAKRVIEDIAKDQPEDVRRFVSGFLVDCFGHDVWCDWWANERSNRF
jgi:hypothetical protein